MESVRLNFRIFCFCALQAHSARFMNFDCYIKRRCTCISYHIYFYLCIYVCCEVPSRSICLFKYTLNAISYDLLYIHAEIERKERSEEDGELETGSKQPERRHRQSTLGFFTMRALMLWAHTVSFGSLNVCLQFTVCFRLVEREWDYGKLHLARSLSLPFCSQFFCIHGSRHHRFDK